MAAATLMIVVAAFTKLFGLVGVQPVPAVSAEREVRPLFRAVGRWRSALLPLLAVSPAQLVRLYESWWRLLSIDYGQSAGLSVMAWLQSWFRVAPPNSVVVLVGIVLFCWPLLYVAALSRLRVPSALPLQRPHLGRDLQSQGRVVVLHHRDVRRRLVVLRAGADPAEHGPRRRWPLSSRPCRRPTSFRARCRRRFSCPTRSRPCRAF